MANNAPGHPAQEGLESRARDNGRVLVLVGAVILTTISYTLWSRWTDDERIREQPLLLIVPMAICALPLVSRRLSSALAILSGFILLALCLVYAIFGGMVYLPEVFMLFAAAVPAWSRWAVTVVLSVVAAAGFLSQRDPAWRFFGWMATGITAVAVLYRVIPMTRGRSLPASRGDDRSAAV